MREFDFYSPTSVPEALELLRKYKDSNAIVAGGTDIVIELNERKHTPKVVIDIKRLKELEYIRFEDGLVKIGALTSHAAIAADPRIAERTRVLHTACAEVGSPDSEPGYHRRQPEHGLRGRRRRGGHGDLGRVRGAPQQGRRADHEACGLP